MRQLLIAFAALFIAAPAFGQVDLDAAWQREYAWLESEKRALTERLAKSSTDADASVRAVEADIATLQARLVALTAEADRSEERLLEIETTVAERAEDDARLASAIEQAERTVGAAAPDLSDPARVRRMLTEAAAQIRRAGSVRTEPGTFFAQDGTDVRGEITYIGSVAAFGVSGPTAGPLVPAGGQRWKLFGGEAGGAGEGLMLLENLERQFNEQPEKTLALVMEQGGVIGWVIVALGLIAGLMLAIRAAILFTVPRKLEDSILATVVGAPGLKRRQREEVLDQQMIEAGGTVGRFAVPVSVVAAVAPLLGLLGTVTGMIGTFEIITRFGTGDPKMLSGGISEALVTTQLGLIVAIPCLLLGSLLSARADRVLDVIENRALEGIRRVGKGHAETATDLAPPEPEVVDSPEPPAALAPEAVHA